MKTVIIADCLPGFHHPPGRPDVCVPDAPPVPVQVPAVSDFGLLALSLMVAALVAWRR